MFDLVAEWIWPAKKNGADRVVPAPQIEERSSIMLAIKRAIAQTRSDPSTTRSISEKTY